MSAQSARPAPVRRLRQPRRLLWAAAAAAVAGIAAAVVAHALVTTKAPGTGGLPELHGQATWPAGARAAPSFALPDVLGGTGSLAALRGRVTLIAFLGSRCAGPCPFLGQAIGAAEASLPAAARPAVVVISVDPAADDATRVRAALRRWHAPAGWQWLTGTPHQLEAVYRAYGLERGTSRKPLPLASALYLVDAHGYERAGYVPPILPTFLALDIRRVEAERAAAG